MKKNTVYCSGDSKHRTDTDAIYEYDYYDYSDDDDEENERVSRDKQRRLNRRKKQYDKTHNLEQD